MTPAVFLGQRHLWYHDVQVPEDTFFFLLGAGMHKARQDFYWMIRGGIKAM